MSSAARSSAGDATAGGMSEHLERLRSVFEAYNELARIEGDVLAWEREWFDPRAEYRPIEDRDWFRDPESITRSITRWMDTWGAGTHRITPAEILELGEERFLVTARNSGIGRRSGVPIEATTYMAMSWREGKIVWFDEYLDRQAALAAMGERVPAAGRPAPDPRATLAERLLKLGEAAFAAFVRGRSDRQVERMFGSDRALHAIFRRMEQLFEPAKAGDFVGEIQYELLGSEDVKKWVVRIDGGRATTRAGEAHAPVTTLRTRLPLFVRMAARELHPVTAYREGLLDINGHFDVATRMEAMFGLSTKQPLRQ
jgi:SCP-2 sterol transfer family protein